MRPFKIATLAMLLLSVASPTLADTLRTLPEGVTPLTSKQVVRIYAGNTLAFPGFSYFYDPQGGVLGFSPSPSSVALGSWSVADNRFCVDVTWRAAAGTAKTPFKACYDWFGKGQGQSLVYWTQISSSSDSTLVGNVYQGNPQIVLHGDQVSNKLSSLTISDQ